MRKITMIAMCLISCAVSAIVCDSILAGPMENAGEFQEKIVEREEEQSSGMESGAGGDNITWQDTGGSGKADSTEQSGQQNQQQ